jgi:hypothetical protein
MAMTRMPNDPEGVAGWLLSNYRLHKIGSGEPVDKFYGRKKTKRYEDDDNEDVEVEETEFMKRAMGRKKPKNIQEMLAKAKSKGNSKLKQMASHLAQISEDEEEIDGSYEDDDSEDENPSKSELAMLNHYRKIAEGNYSEPPSEDSGQPSQIEKVLSQSREGQNVLREIEMKRMIAQESLETGEGFVRRAR